MAIPLGPQASQWKRLHDVVSEQALDVDAEAKTFNLSESKALRAGELLGAQLASFATFLDPQAIVLAGGLLQPGGLLYDSMIRTYIDVFDEVHVVDIRNSGNVILLALPHQPKLTKETLARQARDLSREKKFPFNLGRLVKYGCRPPDKEEKSAPILLDKRKKPSDPGED